MRGLGGPGASVRANGSRTAPAAMQAGGGGQLDGVLAFRGRCAWVVQWRRFGGGDSRPRRRRGACGGWSRRASGPELSRLHAGQSRETPGRLSRSDLLAPQLALDAKPFSITATTAGASYAQNGSISRCWSAQDSQALQRRQDEFFINYSGSLSRNPYNATATFQWHREKLGVIESVTRHHLRSATHLPFSNNTIPIGRIDPSHAGLLSYFPGSESAGTESRIINCSIPCRRIHTASTCA